MNKIKFDINYLQIKDPCHDNVYLYYRDKGYTVYKGNVFEYRGISNCYWNVKTTGRTDSIVKHIQKTVNNDQLYKELQLLFYKKKGLPDLMLIKDNQISFIEVKINRDGISYEQIAILNKLSKMGFKCSIDLFFDMPQKGLF